MIVLRQWDEKQESGTINSDLLLLATHRQVGVKHKKECLHILVLSLSSKENCIKD